MTTANAPTHLVGTKITFSIPVTADTDDAAIDAALKRLTDALRQAFPEAAPPRLSDAAASRIYPVSRVSDPLAARPVA
jgi:hypothetical protein